MQLHRKIGVEIELLAPGFEALEGDGGLVARCVDDLTLQDDLDRRASPKQGWSATTSAC